MTSRESAARNTGFIRQNRPACRTLPDESGVSRVFVALKVSAELAAALLDLQAAVKRRLPAGAVRWSSRDQLHLTLRFLGNVALARIPELTRALGEACRNTPVLRLAPGEFGAFPALDQPRVLWLGLGGDLAGLHQLQAQVAAASAGFGNHVEERDFHPHLTVGRMPTRGGGDPRAVGQAWSDARLGWHGEWDASVVSLVRSELEPGGAVYTDLGEFALSPRA